VTASSVCVANREDRVPRKPQNDSDTYGSCRFDPVRDVAYTNWQSRGRRFDPAQLHHFNPSSRFMPARDSSSAVDLKANSIQSVNSWGAQPLAFSIPLKT